jgi:hypothetical protein
MSVTIGNSVSTISDYVFFDCTSLTNITFKQVTSTIVTFGNSIFNNSLNNNIYLSNVYLTYSNVSIQTYSATNYPTVTVTVIQSPPPPPPCFKEGSKILTNKGYKLVEDLRNGDFIKTLKNDYLPIVLIGKSPIYNSGDNERIKNRLYNLLTEKYPELTEDLVLTGCHSILVDSINEYQMIEMGGEEKRLYITDDKLRLFAYLDDKAEPYQEEGTFTVYHLALENENYIGNYGIYANGLLVESCSKRYLLELSGMEFIE